MQFRPRANLTGYVLAGGRSTRMGKDKALLRLGNKPLVQLAVEKLRCLAKEVYVLANRHELESYGTLVADLHEGCGPLGGLEAALRNTPNDWILVLPVDMPFVPWVLLESWADHVMQHATARISLFSVEGRVQPALSMLHRELTPYIADAIEQGSLSLYPVLAGASGMLADRYRLPLKDVFFQYEWRGEFTGTPFATLEKSAYLTKEQRAAKHLWFANLNTPEEFALAETLNGALD